MDAGKRVPPGRRGTDIEVETTIGALIAALDGDLEIRAEATDVTRLLDRCLLVDARAGVVTLGKGLTVFRPAMTMRRRRGQPSLHQGDYEPLAIHYDEQIARSTSWRSMQGEGWRLMPDAWRSPPTTSPWKRRVSQRVAAAADRTPSTSRSRRRHGAQSSRLSETRSNSGSSPTTACSRTCWCSPAPARARRAFWCTASPI